MIPETKQNVGKSVHKNILKIMDSLDINDKNKYFCDDKYFQNPELIIMIFY